MGTRGGRRSTSYTPTWKHGKTQTIRVPIILAEQGLEVIRILDERPNTNLIEVITALYEKKNIDQPPPIDVTQAKSEQHIDILTAVLAELNKYICTNQISTRGNQHKRKGESKNITKCRDWKHLLKFKYAIEAKINETT